MILKPLVNTNSEGVSEDEMPIIAGLPHVAGSEFKFHILPFLYTQVQGHHSPQILISTRQEFGQHCPRRIYVASVVRHAIHTIGP